MNHKFIVFYNWISFLFLSMQNVITKIEQLLPLLENEDNGVITIKSRIFFEILEKITNVKERDFKLIYPSTGIGSTTIFEVTLLSLFIKIINAKKITEIGTFLGYTTSIMALNSSNDCEIITIDLPKNNYKTQNNLVDRDFLMKDWEANDDFLRSTQDELGEIYINNQDKEILNKIKKFKVDSTKLTKEFLQEINGSDLFFIDGGHAQEIIEIDTNNALQSIKENGLICWHDYNSKTHIEVTQFIDNKFSINHKVLHIENTMLAIYSKNLFSFFYPYQ